MIDGPFLPCWIVGGLPGDFPIDLPVDFLSLVSPFSSSLFLPVVFVLFTLPSPRSSRSPLLLPNCRAFLSNDLIIPAAHNAHPQRDRYQFQQLFVTELGAPLAEDGALHGVSAPRG
jgi:hypothetical protein